MSAKKLPRNFHGNRTAIFMPFYGVRHYDCQYN